MEDPREIVEYLSRAIAGSPLHLRSDAIVEPSSMFPIMLPSEDLSFRTMVNRNAACMNNLEQFLKSHPSGTCSLGTGLDRFTDAHWCILNSGRYRILGPVQIPGLGTANREIF